MRGSEGGRMAGFGWVSVEMPPGATGAGSCGSSNKYNSSGLPEQSPMPVDDPVMIKNLTSQVSFPPLLRRAKSDIAESN